MRNSSLDVLCGSIWSQRLHALRRPGDLFPWPGIRQSHAPAGATLEITWIESGRAHGVVPCLQVTPRCSVEAVVIPRNRRGVHRLLFSQPCLNCGNYHFLGPELAWFVCRCAAWCRWLHCPRAGDRADRGCCPFAAAGAVGDHPRASWPRCAPICANESACWTTVRRTSSICRRR